MTATAGPDDTEPEAWDDEPEPPEPVVAARSRVPRVTGLLLLIVFAAAGFLAGVLTQKHHDRHLTATATSATTARTGTAGGAVAGGAAAGGAGGGATFGQVKLVDGTTLYVTDASGNTVTITTSNASKVSKQQTVALNQVQPGDTVVVRGPQADDGSIAATTIVDSGAGGTFGGFGGRRGGGAAGAGAGAGRAGAGQAGAGGVPGG